MNACPTERFRKQPQYRPSSGGLENISGGFEPLKSISPSFIARKRHAY
jgi:hypothetical protein